MWRDLIGAYLVIFVDLGNKDAAIVHKPGEDGFIVLHEKLKGQDNLDKIIALLEGYKTLTPRQRLQKQVLFLEDGNSVYRVPGTSKNWSAGRTVRFNQYDRQAEFCMN